MTPPVTQIHDESAVQALIVRCLNGDQAAYAELFDKVAPGLYRLAYSILLHQARRGRRGARIVVYAYRHLRNYDQQRGCAQDLAVHDHGQPLSQRPRRKWLPTTALSNLLRWRRASRAG